MSMPNHDCKVHTHTERKKDLLDLFVCSPQNRRVSLPVCQTRFFDLYRAHTAAELPFFSVSPFWCRHLNIVFILYNTHFNNDLLLLFLCLLKDFDNNWSVQCKCFNLICLSTCFDGLCSVCRATKNVENARYHFACNRKIYLSILSVGICCSVFLLYVDEYARVRLESSLL